MSTQKITSSARKMEGYSLARERDRAALEIAEREGCSFFESYTKVLDGTATIPPLPSASQSLPA